MFRLLASVVVTSLVVGPASGLAPKAWTAHDESNFMRMGDSGGHAHVASATQLRQNQPVGTTETTHENWFQRMGNALIGAIVGVVMIIFSIPILWLNEKRNAKYESLIERGQKECRSISADFFDDSHTNSLVHVTGETNSTRPVKDRQFNVSYDSGVVRVSSHVQVYQYVEEEKSESKGQETLGGGRTTETRRWKEYTAQWCSSWNSGANFEMHEYRNPPMPKGLSTGNFSETCTRVEFGSGFLFDDNQLSQLSGGSNLKMDKVTLEGNEQRQFEAGDEGWYYGRQGATTSPEVGDVRVHFTVLHDGPATVVGLQVQRHGEEKGRGGFLPYRQIQRPFCGQLSDDEAKERLYIEGKMDKSEINAKEMWGGAFAGICCTCNLVQTIFGGAMSTELLDAWGETLSKSEAFDRIRVWANTAKWIWRGVGWLLMFIGLCLFFGPLTTSLKLLPFGIGTFLSSIGSFVIFVFSFVVTLVLSALIVCLAYCMYNPVYGIFMITCLGAVIAAGLSILPHANGVTAF